MIADVEEDIDFIHPSFLYYTDLLKLIKLGELEENISIDDLKKKFKRIINKKKFLYEREYLDGTIKEIVERNKLFLSRYNQNSKDIFFSLSNLYTFLKRENKNNTYLLMNEIFSLKKEKEVIFITSFIQKIFNLESEFHFSELLGNITICLSILEDYGITNISDINSDIDSDTLELILHDIRTFDTKVSSKKKKGISICPIEWKKIKKIYWEDLWKKLIEKFWHQLKKLNTITEIGGKINGMGIIFGNWAYNTEKLSIDDLKKIRSLFSCLNNFNIKNFDNLEKIFNFLLDIELEDLEDRIMKLYEFFIATTPKNYDEFKSVVLKYIKNGDDIILKNYRDKNSSNIPRKEKKEKKLLIDDNIVIITAREAIIKIEKLGFKRSRSRWSVSSGSHTLFYNPKTNKRVLIAVHARDIPKGSLMKIIKHSWVKSMKEWNSL